MSNLRKVKLRKGNWNSNEFHDTICLFHGVYKDCVIVENPSNEMIYNYDRHSENSGYAVSAKGLGHIPFWAIYFIDNEIANDIIESIEKT